MKRVFGFLAAATFVVACGGGDTTGEQGDVSVPGSGLDPAASEAVEGAEGMAEEAGEAATEAASEAATEAASEVEKAKESVAGELPE